MKQKERLGCGKHQFPNRDRRTASPLASPQQPVDHVFLRGLTPPKSCRPLLSHADRNANRFYGHRRKTEPREFFRLLWRYLLVSVIVPPSELRRPRWML